jgi:hypothetical protein
MAEPRRMETEDEGTALHPSFFEGRLLVDILSWEWNLSVGLSRVGPRKYRFQGGLDLVRTIRLEGRIQAPQEHRGRDIEIDVYPFGRDLRFGRRGLKSVGSVAPFGSATERSSCRASLLLPEANLAFLAVALSTTARYLHIWTRELNVEAASITDYSLSSMIGDKVKSWAGVDE